MVTSSFKERLMCELLRRKRINNLYSLRAMARDLELEPSFLSKLLSGKRTFSPRVVERIATRLKWEVPADGVTEDYKGLPSDHFEIISDWYHYAILELMTLPSFRSKPEWIAEQLGITCDEATGAIARLLKVGILEKDAKGNLINIGGNHTTTTTPFTALAFKNLQKQVLSLALKAIDTIPYENRDQTSMTLAIDHRDIPLAKQMMKKFRRTFTKNLQSRGKKSQVFHLSVSFYPVSSIPPSNSQGVPK